MTENSKVHIIPPVPLKRDIAKYIESKAREVKKI